MSFKANQSKTPDPIDPNLSEEAFQLITPTNSNSKPKENQSGVHKIVDIIRMNYQLSINPSIHFINEDESPTKDLSIEISADFQALFLKELAENFLLPAKDLITDKIYTNIDELTLDIMNKAIQFCNLLFQDQYKTKITHQTIRTIQEILRSNSWKTRTDIVEIMMDLKAVLAPAVKLKHLDGTEKIIPSRLKFI